MKLFETVLEMSLSAAIAIGAVLILRLVLLRMPKGFTWFLWLAVLARLWVPVFPEVSLPVRVPEVESAAVREQVFPHQMPAEAVGSAEQTATEAPGLPDTPEMEPLPILWGLGVCSVAAWGICSDVRLRKRLRIAVRREDGVWMADGIESPFVHGLLRSHIYLPSDWDGVGERYILLHERQHIRSLDPVVKLLFFGALCIHWFNPLVWLACYYAERDMELRCDEGVFRSLNREERTEYAAALMALASRRRELLPLAFGEGDTKRRVKNMLTYRKPKWWAIVLAAVLCITAAGCMLTDPALESDPAKHELPGLKWGISPEEVLSALERGESDIAYEDEDHNEDMDVDYWRYVMILHGVEAFGQETTAAMFAFVDYTQTGESYLLNEIKLCYPDGYDGSEKADAAALEAELKRNYGEPNEAKHWDWQKRKDVEINQERPANLYEWDSAVTGWDCLTKEQQEGVCEDYEASRTEGSFSLERYLERWKVPAFRISFQPYWHRVMALGNHPLTEENRSLGLTDFCISLDAITFFGFQHSAEVILGTE